VADDVARALSSRVAVEGICRRQRKAACKRDRASGKPTVETTDESKTSVAGGESGLSHGGQWKNPLRVCPSLEWIRYKEIKSA
jgi:hypothetical protein